LLVHLGAPEGTIEDDGHVAAVDEATTKDGAKIAGAAGACSEDVHVSATNLDG
jgi:hypothetical protein